MQKSLVEKHFPCFKCSFIHRHLLCEGKIIPSDDCDSYDVKISYRFGGIPRVRVISPPIAPSAAIHMYTNGSLCLFFPDDDPWMTSDDIHVKIIPWTAEWLVFYEMYKVCGKWLGPEAPHALNAEKIEAKQSTSSEE